jgi:hypothetical protein
MQKLEIKKTRHQRKARNGHTWRIRNHPILKFYIVDAICGVRVDRRRRVYRYKSARNLRSACDGPTHSVRRRRCDNLISTTYTYITVLSIVLLLFLSWRSVNETIYIYI